EHEITKNERSKLKAVFAFSPETNRRKQRKRRAVFLSSLRCLLFTFPMRNFPPNPQAPKKKFWFSRLFASSFPPSAKSQGRDKEDHEITKNERSKLKAVFAFSPETNRRKRRKRRAVFLCFLRCFLFIFPHEIYRAKTPSRQEILCVSASL